MQPLLFKLHNAKLVSEPGTNFTIAVKFFEKGFLHNLFRDFRCAHSTYAMYKDISSLKELLKDLVTSKAFLHRLILHIVKQKREKSGTLTWKKDFDTNIKRRNRIKAEGASSLASIIGTKPQSWQLVLWESHLPQGTRRGFDNKSKTKHCKFKSKVTLLMAAKARPTPRTVSRAARMPLQN